METTENRFWFIDCDDEEVAAVEAAAGIALVALVDEEAGGIVGYVQPALAAEMVRLLNGAA